MIHAALKDLLPPTLPSRFSVSFIGSAGECILKAKMQRDGDGGGPLATIGRVAHEVFATCELLAQFQGRAQVSSDEALAVAERVMSNPEEAAPLSLNAFRTVLHMVDVWASTTTFPVDADRWVIEHPFRRRLVDPLNGDVYIVSGRMDEVAMWGTHYRNRDWKTGPGLPTKKKVEEEHTQLPLYWWEAAQAWPHLESAECSEVYCRYGVPRSVTLTRQDLPEIEAYLLVALRRLTAAYRNNRFPVQTGAWCNSSCPNPGACPLPDHVKGEGGLVASDEDARNQIETMSVERARIAKRTAAVRGYLDGTVTGTVMVHGKEHGHIRTKKRKLDEERLAAVLAQHGLSKDDLYIEEPTTEFKVS